MACRASRSSAFVYPDTRASVRSRDNAVVRCARVWRRWTALRAYKGVSGRSVSGRAAARLRPSFTGSGIGSRTGQCPYVPPGVLYVCGAFSFAFIFALPSCRHSCSRCAFIVGMLACGAPHLWHASGRARTLLARDMNFCHVSRRSVRAL